MSDTNEVLTERQGPVLLLTLNRPDHLNAWTSVMQRQYFEVLTNAEQDPEIRVVIVTGAGRAFCAGTDLTAPVALDADTYASDRGPISQPARMTTPVISVINGTVAGLGLIAALFTDVRFAASDAAFTTALSRSALLADDGVTTLLPRLIGISESIDALLKPRTFTGAEAAQLGLVDWAMPGDEVMAAALSYACDLAYRRSTPSLAELKHRARPETGAANVSHRPWAPTPKLSG